MTIPSIVPELFRATLGFDFIFAMRDGRKVPLCIEINGEDSGLKAVETIPAGYLSDADRERVRVRMTHTPERLRLSAYAESLDPVTRVEAKKKAWKAARSVPGFVHAFQNPQFIRDMLASKKNQQDFIPSQYKPRPYVSGDPALSSPLSSTGFWICKPVGGRKGKGIKILSNDEFAVFLGTEARDGYLCQELVLACGAERALPGMKNNPASMRLLMDFICRTDGTIEEVFSFAYQRISPHSAENGFLVDSMEDVFVVNAARDALAMSVSENELILGREAALLIIQNLRAIAPASNPSINEL